ncbi:Adenylate cyclase [hydrothermal vent metagenome]|uniref:Adenylate cyclase n=1 Tax=hydrothermal vent metagenome TaxID=652676 RepID=A0A3B1A5M5_9ZZZZ
MPIEIERKYLLRNDDWRLDADQGTQYEQGYIIGSDKASVRVRIQGAEAFINIKSATLGIKRQEFEYGIPLDEAREILSSLCEKPLVIKTRYIVNVNGDKWEIDVFDGGNKGLIVAEIELQSEDQSIELPAWCGQEVSEDPRYYNVNLAKHPYTKW